jgi:hypothetical protein
LLSGFRLAVECENDNELIVDGTISLSRFTALSLWDCPTTHFKRSLKYHEFIVSKKREP